VARRPKIGFVLGSGAARGWAHIGVLGALSDEGVRPDLIAGCSIGALVGASFAAGRLDQLEAWALALDWKSMLGLLDIRLRGGGIIKGERVADFFREQFVEREFSELAIPFAAVATDVTSGQEIWLREGKVSDAVRASIAVPGLFRPVLREDRYLVDGGVVNPVPVSLARAMGADIVIAVDVGSDIVGRHARRKREDSNTQTGRYRLLDKLFPRRGDATAEEGETGAPPSMLEALMGSIDVMQVRIARSRLAGEPPDVLLTPRLAHLGSLDYHRAEIAIAEGREAVARMLPAIRDAVPA
jgi:NTE family protein